MNIFERIQDFIGNPIQVVMQLLVVLIALSFHEWGHAFIAYKMGDDTAQRMGRMTFDPLKHIDWLGFLSMMLVGFGWAKPVPVNPNNFRKRKLGMVLVSLAGITVNFLLAFVSIFILMGILRFAAPSEGSILSYAADFFYLFAIVNLSLMVFNLIPVPPLDGYNALKQFVLGRMNLNWLWTLERYGSIILIVLVFSGVTSSIIQSVVGGIFGGILSLAAMVFRL